MAPPTKRKFWRKTGHVAIALFLFASALLLLGLAYLAGTQDHVFFTALLAIWAAVFLVSAWRFIVL